jgi:hypothetical protein
LKKLEEVMNTDVRTVATTVVGKMKNEASAIIVAAGCIMRVVSEDGLQFVGTADHMMNRINVELIDGRVIGAYVG